MYVCPLLCYTRRTGSRTHWQALRWEPLRPNLYECVCTLFFCWCGGKNCSLSLSLSHFIPLMAYSVAPRFIGTPFGQLPSSCAFQNELFINFPFSFSMSRKWWWRRARVRFGSSLASALYLSFRPARPLTNQKTIINCVTLHVVCNPLIHCLMIRFYVWFEILNESFANFNVESLSLSFSVCMCVCVCRGVTRSIVFQLPQFFLSLSLSPAVRMLFACSSRSLARSLVALALPHSHFAAAFVRFSFLASPKLEA